jgi:hypothetical protein
MKECSQSYAKVIILTVIRTNSFKVVIQLFPIIPNDANCEIGALDNREIKGTLLRA